MSDNRSYGSNFFTGSRSRKISIGVMVDSSTRTPGSIRDTEVAVPTVLGVDANKQDLAGGGVAVDRRRLNERHEHEESPWITKRSIHKNSSSAEGVYHVKLAGNKTDKKEKHSKPNGLKGAPVDHSVPLFPDQAPFLQSDHVSPKRFDGHKINEERNENAETVHKCAASTVRVVPAPEGATLGDKTGSTVKNQSESLRIKLRELLETVSSPNKEKLSSQPVEVGVTSLQPEQNWNQTGDAVTRPKQNSDTIENDSESPDCSNRRPATRALTRKRASSKLRQKKLESDLLSADKQKSKKRNIFTFEEGHIGKRRTAKRSSSKVTSNKKTERKYARIAPRELSFSSKNNHDGNQHSTDKNENSPSEERSFPHGYRRSLRDFTLPVNINPEKISQEKDLPGQPAISKPCQHEAINSPALARKKDKREGTGNPFPKGYVDQQDDFPSPTFQRTGMAGFSPSPSIPGDQSEQEAGNSAQGKGIFYEKDILSFKSFHLRKLQDRSGVQSETFEVAKELPVPDSPPRNAVPSKVDIDHSSSESSSDEKESESSEEEGPHEEEVFSPETGVAEKLKFMLHRTKRLCRDEGIQSHDSDPASSSPKETGESNLARHKVEENTEDGYARDIGLLALALEKLKSKLKSVTRKKSDEILTSVTARIHVQLQTVESQIQSDMGKLKSLNKQKRKRLETEFQEQDEQLNLIHGNFLKEISRHLQSFKGAIEGHEKNKIHLAEVMEKQKASHRKLIMQLEEAIGTQLHDAEKRISDMNKVAREQMLQLKLVIEKCVEGGLLS